MLARGGESDARGWVASPRGHGRWGPVRAARGEASGACLPDADAGSLEAGAPGGAASRPGGREGGGRVARAGAGPGRQG